MSVIASIFDEIGLFSATPGTEQEQKMFITLLREAY
jgi:hypothetical protein